MLIEVRGVQFVNKGAELMLYAVLEQVQHHLPEASIVLEPGINSPYQERAKLGALQKFSLKKGKWDLNAWSYRLPVKLRRWLQTQWGIVTEADIDVVLDASGFAYGDQWPSIKIQHLCSELNRAGSTGHQYIFLPQAFGPFTRERDRALLSKALSKATLVCAREKTSFDHLSELMREVNNLVQYPDFTNLVSPIVPEEWAKKQDILLIIPNYNMLSERNQNKSWASNYIELMVDVIKQGQAMGLQPIILNHEGKADQAVCEQMASRAGGSSIPIVQEAHPLKVKGIIKSSRLVVCSRFHGCVSALSQGIPCLGTSWSHKYERLFEEYQLADCLLKPEARRDELAELIRRALTSVSRSEESRRRLKQETQQMWQKVMRALDS